MSRYGSYTRSAYYGAVAALPLLLAYEALLAWSGTPGFFQVRNAADVWLRLLLFSLGAGHSLATWVTILLLVAAIALARPADMPLVPGYFALLLLEAIGYSAALGAASLLLPWAVSAAMPHGVETASAIANALGAGLFEELAFRVILFTGLFWLARRVLGPKPALVLAVLGASLLFSLAHYAGPDGEAFNLGTFAFRWGAGLAFTMLYAGRGFGVTAYTHAFYDLWALLI